MSNEKDLPQYPALASCLLVESRLGSRHELEKDLKSMDLFVELKVSKSLSAARLTLELEDIDCCVFGPYLTPSSIRELLSWAPEHAKSKDCAYIVISEEGSEERFIDDGAHSQVWRPLTKAKFFDAVVRAVVAANKNSSWKSVFENSEFHRNFDVEVASPLLASSAKREVIFDALQNPRSFLGSGAPVTDDLEEIQKFFEKTNLVFLDGGEPTPELKAAATTLLALLFPNGNPENMRFYKHCLKAAFAWFENAPLGGFSEATDQLRITILQFRG